MHVKYKKKKKKWYKRTYTQNRYRPTDTENKLMVTKVDRTWEAQIRSLGLTYTHFFIYTLYMFINSNMHTSIYKIDNKDFLYSRGNYTQYLVINYKGRLWKRYSYILIYTTESHCLNLKLKQHCKSTILQY